MSERSYTFIYAAIGGLVGVISTFWIAMIPDSDDAWSMILSATLAGLVSAGLAWAFIMNRPGGKPVPRAIVTGIATTVLAHVLLWIIFVILGNLLTTIFGEFKNSMLENPPALSDAFYAAALFAPFGLMIAGLPQFLAAAGTAFFLDRMRRRRRAGE